MIAFIALLVPCLGAAIAYTELRLRGRMSGPPVLLPSASGPCGCGHAKVYHDKGSGACRELDNNKEYVRGGGHPPCRCQTYLPKDAPAIPLAKSGEYDPLYTAFLEVLNEHWPEIEKKVRP